MNKLLFIVGPTAVGKTSLGFYLANKFKGEIISSDSRQVYKGMDIGTGKDVAKSSKWQTSNVKYKNKKLGFFKSKNIKIWGYDLLNPNEKFSVSQFSQIASLIIRDIFGRNKLPIIVGGTGFYLNSLAEPFATINIPPDQQLRNRLEMLDLNKLQKELANLDPNRFNKMNQSDINNHRRLIRAIEVSLYKKTTKITEGESLQGIEKMLWIGLTAAKEDLYQMIDKRVDERVKKGAQKEIKALLRKGYSFKLQSMSALGYIQWQSFFNNSSSKEDVIKRWKLDEHAYARRQITWFKKNNKINWFNITSSNWRDEVVEKVKQWYSVNY